MKADAIKAGTPMIFTSRKRSWGKVMFLHLSVILEMFRDEIQAITDAKELATFSDSIQLRFVCVHLQKYQK